MSVILPCLVIAVTDGVIRHYLAERRRQEIIQWRQSWDEAERQSESSTGRRRGWDQMN